MSGLPMCIFGGVRGILPRAQKQSTGLFFAGVAVALFESLSLNTVQKKENAKMRSLIFWRSERDSKHLKTQIQSSEIADSVYFAV